MGKLGTRGLWAVWIIGSLVMIALLTAGLTAKPVAGKGIRAQLRTYFLPGPTSHGHHQIELACESCHTSPFGGAEVLQEACVNCHGAELKDADDKHPLTKFTDPRNAALLAGLDARQCVTCHVEHKPEMTAVMGVTQPADFCVHCHQGIAEERPSHRGMAFDTCASAGCHNFHDNRALYEDFLLRNAEQPRTLPKPAIRDVHSGFAEIAQYLPGYPSDRYPVKALGAQDIDAPAGSREHQESVSDWLASAHARAGVNCTACHETQGEDQTSVWIDRPQQTVCGSCHQLQTKGFQSGKHGMRIAAGLSPMTPAQARIPMRAEASHRELTCTTCHTAHKFDTRAAAVEACLGCHGDEHSLAYERSEHARLWRAEVAGDAPPGAGVSCASCHMPRLEHRHPDFDLKQIYVEHNQNSTLRPNEKMIRPVCMQCHGYGFAVDALADSALIRTNFNGEPRVQVKSIAMALERLREAEERRRNRPREE